MNPSEKITAGLNPMQKRAVETLDGPLLILAGAGSGKTRVLVHRVANLILQRRASPQEILAVTFTNKAAKEMESRIFQILSDFGISVMEPLWISTFHSFCTRILRSHAELLDYRSHFTIYDDGDQLSQIKKIMNALNISDKIYPAKTFRNKINWAKTLGLSPDEAEKSKSVLLDSKSIEVYRQYEIEMKKANALDFGDLLLKCNELFKMYPQVLEAYQDQFKYIMVDEYQDTNHIQYLLIKQLGQKHQSVCVVGDEDQSIYSWRGADITNILEFEQDFPKAQLIKLEENYRSTHNIVKGASAVIANNRARKDKTLFTSNSAGDLIEIREEATDYDEARWVAKKIQAMVSEGQFDFADFAVFYRTNAQSRVIEEQLRFMSIPYQLVGGVRFYERLEIKDILSYLKLSLNGNDDVAFKRVVNVPTRGIGKTTVERLEELSISHKESLSQATLRAIDHREFNAGTTSKLRKFMDLITELQGLVNQYSLLDFYHLVLEKTEYLARLKAEQSVESESRIQNLEELSNALAQFTRERPQANLTQFLEEMALVSDVDQLKDTPQGVTLMTLHVSKGLEFPVVFIVGLEENLFPSQRGDDDDQDSEIEEERRLAYVGMTRARKQLFLTYAKTRKVWGQDQYNPPSRFLKEIPNDLVSFHSALTSASGRSRFVDRFQGETSYAGRSYNSDYGSRRNKYSDSDFESQSFPEEDFSQAGNGAYQKGQKVRHPTFGAGSVFQVEGSGDQQKVSVLFADQTIKKFVVKYARLERI